MTLYNRIGISDQRFNSLAKEDHHEVKGVFESEEIGQERTETPIDYFSHIVLYFHEMFDKSLLLTDFFRF